jgi:hypothetical protein
MSDPLQPDRSSRSETPPRAGRGEHRGPVIVAVIGVIGALLVAIVQSGPTWLGQARGKTIDRTDSVQPRVPGPNPGPVPKSASVATPALKRQPTREPIREPRAKPISGPTPGPTPGASALTLSPALSLALEQIGQNASDLVESGCLDLDATAVHDCSGDYDIRWPQRTGQLYAAHGARYTPLGTLSRDEYAAFTADSLTGRSYRDSVAPIPAPDGGALGVRTSRGSYAVFRRRDDGRRTGRIYYEFMVFGKLKL